MQDSREEIIQQWIDHWIIQHNFCPFAKPVRSQNKIKISICDSTLWPEVLAQFHDECNELLISDKYSTCLLAISNATNDFLDYLALLESAQTLLEKQNWLGIFQLASFHPDYLFAGEAENSVSHYTNRSPVAMIHILREQDVTDAIPSQRHADEIVSRNMQRLEQIGVSHAHAQITQWRERFIQLS